MANSEPRAPAALRVLTLMILIFLAISQWLGEQARFNGVDFYQLWGVGAAQKLSGHSLGSPYTERERYAVVLNDYAGTVDYPSLTTASAVWKRLALTATPLLYVSFSMLPRDYSVAIGLFRGLQLLLFLLAFCILGIQYRYDRFQMACMALLFVLFFGPFRSDLRVGNVGSVQLFCLAVILALAESLANGRQLPPRATLGVLLLSSSAAVTLAKPNIGLIGVLMAAHLWIRHGGRFFARVAIPTVAVCAILYIIPCVYFGSWRVWYEWYEFFTRSGSKTPASLSIDRGDYSSALFVASWLGVNVHAAALAMAAVLIVSLLCVIVVSPGALRGAGSSRAATIVGALRRIFSDSTLVIAGGIALTIAISPLVWFHYYVLIIIPAFWLLNGTRRSDQVLGLAAITLSSGMLTVLFAPLGWTGAVPITIAASWIPLWCAILLHSRATDMQTNVASGLEKGSNEPGRREPTQARTGKKSKPAPRR
jgi:hypothetical protein